MAILSRFALAGLVLCAFSLGGCSAAAESSAITVRDSAGITIVENDLARLTAACAIPAEPTVNIGASEGDEAYQLHRVFGARQLSDGRIVLVNQGSQQIRFYDGTGKFVGASGRAGQGPGEFSRAFLLWVLPGDTIWVGDYDPWQFLVFGPDGTWRRTVRPSPQYNNSPDVINVLDDGRSVLARSPFQSRDPNAFRLQHLTPVIHGPDGTLIDTIGTYPNGRIGNLGSDPSGPWAAPLFESHLRVAASGSRVVIGHGSKAELTVHRAGDSLQAERIVRWTTGDRTVTAAMIEAERKRLRDQYPDLDPAMYRRLVEPLIREDRPAADEFPAFAGIMLGRDGRIWAREYPMPDRADTRSYLAFDADGRFVCRARMPAFSNLLEFGSDYLLAHARDSLGVERVLRFPISPPVEPK